MFMNYLKITFRTMKKQKGYSFINIAGLAVGMACCMLIMLWVQDELSYDRFHEHADDTYRVVYVSSASKQAATHGPLAAALKERYPEVVESVRIETAPRMVLSYRSEDKHAGDRTFYEDRIILADPSLFSIFSFPFVEGSPETALVNPLSIVITEAMAWKYFGDENPVGKSISVNGMFNPTVTGVIKNVPYNSHLQFDFIVPFVVLKMLGQNIDAWNATGYFTYVQPQKNTDYTEFSGQIENIFRDYAPEYNMNAALQPLTDIHLHSDYRFDLAGHGDAKYVYIFSGIAILILFIACINFINLSTARSVNRAKEVGMRKIVGAGRDQLIKQFMGESFIFAFAALIIAVIAAAAVLPGFNHLSGKSLSIQLTNTAFLTGILCICVLTGAMAGSYPAVVLSSFRPAWILKGYRRRGAVSKRAVMRRALVVAQFASSVLLIAASLVISDQLDFIKNKKLGFDKENIIYIPLGGSGGKYESLKNELLQVPNVTGMAVSEFLPIRMGIETNEVDWQGRQPDASIAMKYKSVDYDYIGVLGMELAAGRNFSPEYATDADAAYILNEEAVRQMELGSPVGKNFSLKNVEGTIIGVVKDANFRSLHNAIEPQAFRLFTNMTSRMAQISGFVYIRIGPGDIPQTLRNIEETWAKIVPGVPSEYHFLDEEYDRLYRDEQRMGMLSRYFTALAVVISCLGLFGLSAYSAEQRTKEIGIRKTLGASEPGIVFMLSKESIAWVLTANIIALPAAWYLLDRWLQEFAYRIDIGAGIFALTGLLTLLIALVTVSFQAIRAARANPVDSLRYE